MSDPVRILLVEDHGDTARILARLLTADGHEVQTAGTVAAAAPFVAGAYGVLYGRLNLDVAPRRIRLAKPWELRLEAPNALTLDTARLSLGGGKLSEPLHILDAHTQAAAAGMGTSFRLHFTFDSLVQPPAPVFLVMETPEKFALHVNGKPVPVPPVREQEWWLDISFRKVEISQAVQAGRNEIVLSGAFGFDQVTADAGPVLLQGRSTAGERPGRDEKIGPRELPAHGARSAQRHHDDE